MREILFALGSLAGAAALTALAVLLPPVSPIWRWMLWIGIAVFAACAAALFSVYIRPNGRLLYVVCMGIGTAVAITCALALFANPPEHDDYVFFSVEIRDAKNLTVTTLPLRINNASDMTFDNVDPWFSPADAKGNPYPRDASNPYWTYRNLKVFYPHLQSGSRLYGPDLPLSTRAWRIEIDSSLSGKSFAFVEFLEIRERAGELISLVDVWRSIGNGPLIPVYHSPRPNGVVTTWKP